jgi:unsaturated rhamnogalacturonyl hydrolase
MRSFLSLIVLSVTLATAAEAQNGMFLITRNYQNRPVGENVYIILDWKELLNHEIVPISGEFNIRDKNFGQLIAKAVIDKDHNNIPEGVGFNYTFKSDEPVFSFQIEPVNMTLEFTEKHAYHDQRLSVTYLNSTKSVLAKGKEIKSWPDKIIESTMSFYPDPAVLPIYAPGNWSYEYAFFLHAMLNRAKESNNAAYTAYVKKWCDRYLDTKGYIDPKHYNVAEYRLDDMLPGRLFISLYESTSQGKYKTAATQLRQQLQYQPRTSDGGYWHKQIYPYQMWLDGVYMADIFTMQYAKAFNEPALFKESMQQIRLIHEHNGDPTTGLLYHGWDEAGNKVWANEDTGTSPEFWSRGIGWYLMALLECIEYVPLESMDRKELGGLFRELARSVIKYQDPKTGLWYQVTNKAYEPRNWIETSGSAMFAYAFAKGYNKGILDKTYLAAAQKAFDTMTKDYIFFDDEGRIYMDGTVKIGTLNIKTSKGDLDYYVTTERRVNDYKGLGALLYLAQELD